MRGSKTRLEAVKRLRPKSRSRDAKELSGNLFLSFMRGLSASSVKNRVKLMPASQTFSGMADASILTCQRFCGSSTRELPQRR